MTRSPRRLKQQLQDTVGEQVRDLPLHAVRLAMFGVGRALLLGDRVTRDYKEITAGGGVRPVLDRLRDDVQGTAEKVVGHVVERVRGDEPESGAGAAPEPAPRAKVAEPPARPKPRPAARTSTDEISVGKPDGETKADPTTGTGAEARHTPKHARPGPPPKPAKPGALGRHHAKPTPRAEPAPAPKPADAAEKPKDAEKPRPAEKAKDAEKPKVEAAKLPVPDYDNATLPQLRARLRGLSADQVRLLREYEREHAAREDVVRMYERRIAKLNGTG